MRGRKESIPMHNVIYYVPRLCPFINSTKSCLQPLRVYLRKFKYNKKTVSQEIQRIQKPK